MQRTSARTTKTTAGCKVKASRSDNRALGRDSSPCSVDDPCFFSRFKAEAAKNALKTRNFNSRPVTVMLSDSNFVFTVSQKNGALTLTKGAARRKKTFYVELPDAFFHKLMSGAVQPMILFNRREWTGDDDPETVSWFFLILPVLSAAYRRAAHSLGEDTV